MFAKSSVRLSSVDKRIFWRLVTDECGLLLSSGNRLVVASGGLGEAWLTRASWSIASGEMAEAWVDLDAALHLGGLLLGGVHPSPMDYLVAMILIDKACRLATSLVSTADAATCQRVQARLAAYAGLPGLRGVVEADRLGALDAYQQLAAGRLVDGQGFATVEVVQRFQRGGVDVNRGLRRLNRVYDELSRTLSMPPGPDQERAVAAWNSAMAAWTDPEDGELRVAGLKPARRFDEEMADVFLALFMPVYKSVHDGWVRMTAGTTLLQAACAQRRYELATGGFAAGWSDLVDAGVLDADAVAAIERAGVRAEREGEALLLSLPVESALGRFGLGGGSGPGP